MKKNLKILIKTEIGNFMLEMSLRGLYAVRFPGKYTPQRPGLCKNTPRKDLVFARVGGVFKKYFKNPLVKLRFLKLDLSGSTDFQKRIYRVLMRIPAGKVITYGKLAQRAGYPGAARAVGSAMKKNRLPIVIPCHRVVPVSGGIGEYSAGKKWKRWLLEYES